uniref:Uncharacterized protein n=1 Tax=Nelumbo nucifera TaxID=4432 RepID=A0A822XS59_NELNU|nr:TPA_asm: hypothetical protein HUJ06_023108 [Nelumbo nucifera]
MCGLGKVITTRIAKSFQPLVEKNKKKKNKSSENLKKNKRVVIYEKMVVELIKPEMEH